MVFFTTLVAIFGTTISPYLFFWQASQEAEDQRIDADAKPLLKAPGQAGPEFRRIRADTLIGMAFSNLIALSIIVTAAASLHRAGTTNIESRAQAAEALRPVAGEFVFVLFALGIIGTGLLAVPSPAPLRMQSAKPMAGVSGCRASPVKPFPHAVLAAAALIGAVIIVTPLIRCRRLTGVSHQRCGRRTCHGHDDGDCFEREVMGDSTTLRVAA